eukprot:TRINITY_DN44759_c0_g1_i3.p1 TRINITY_DN44759_c0_g1~~TRINITY_DN44759_c0_g1_i3.p1  ORF type:complete len:415 (-),score=36.54 TRINITY_DN44759_c0_g1_i3:14-1258(-)
MLQLRLQKLFRYDWVRVVGVLAVLLLLRLAVWPQEDHSHEKDLRDLVFLIERSNRENVVLNPQFLLAPDHIPIVLYVYNRVEYLNRTLEALRDVRGISSTLLIVSHDGAVPEMLQLVRSQATFCRTQVLVHPVSAHRRCTEVGCAIFHVKEHWWWLQRMVWEDAVILKQTPKSTWRLFIEEDHQLSPDAYTLVQDLILRAQVGNTTAARAWGVGLAPMMSRTPEIHQEPAHKLDYHWGMQNAGYAFPLATWHAIRAARSQFWEFHDGWDITMLYLMQLRLINRQVLLPRLARLKNIGVSGATQSTDSYNDTILPRIPVSAGTITSVPLEVGPRVLGKDPARLPIMGPYGVPLNWDAVSPGQLNNNWEGNDQLQIPDTQVLSKKRLFVIALSVVLILSRWYLNRIRKAGCKALVR